jgi:uncharacterized protein (DUF1499 family)
MRSARVGPTVRHSIVATGMLVMSSCWGGSPDNLDKRSGNLAPCPSTPNCVHTGMRYPDGTERMQIRDSVLRRDVMSGLRAVAEAIPRSRIVTETQHYLHMEVRSKVFRFVDDVELLLAPDHELIVRSASRVGRGDFGVNAARVAELRQILDEAGLLR